jgi:hypothetical protein
MGTSTHNETIKVLALFAHNDDISAVDIYRVTSPLNAVSTRTANACSARGCLPDSSS